MDARLIDRTIRCPYCGEAIDILLDLSAGSQSYIEDCHVCCRPIEISFDTDDGRLETLRVGHAG